MKHLAGYRRLKRRCVLQAQWVLVDANGGEDDDSKDGAPIVRNDLTGRSADNDALEPPTVLGTLISLSDSDDDSSDAAEPPQGPVSVRRQHERRRIPELERELSVLRAQRERDQILLEQYDRRVKFLENELRTLTDKVAFGTKPEFLERQATSQYEELAKLYSRLRSDYLNLLNASRTT